MPTLTQILAGKPLLTLHVSLPGQTETSAHIIQHGITIGRGDENAICVVAKRRSRRLVPGVILTLPLVSPRPAGACDEGRRGRFGETTQSGRDRKMGSSRQA